MTELDRLRKKLARVQARIDRDHERQAASQVGTSRYWKADRRLDYDAMEKQKLRVEIARLEVSSNETVCKQDAP